MAWGLGSDFYGKETWTPRGTDSERLGGVFINSCLLLKEDPVQIQLCHFMLCGLGLMA